MRTRMIIDIRPLELDLIALVTGGESKGQGRNQHGLMTQGLLRIPR